MTRIYVWFCATLTLALLAGNAVAADFLKFEYVEHPSRASEPAPYRLLLEVAQDGAFHATWDYIGAPDSLAPIPAQQGALTGPELQQLRDAFAKVELLDEKIASYDIGYSSKPEPGWKGSIQVTGDGITRGARFTSLSPATTERDPSINRLVTLVFDLKNLARDKLHTPVVRAKPTE